MNMYIHLSEQYMPCVKDSKLHSFAKDIIDKGFTKGKYIRRT